jgi:hypothetical protein
VVASERLEGPLTTDPTDAGPDDTPVPLHPREGQESWFERTGANAVWADVGSRPYPWRAIAVGAVVVAALVAAAWVALT